MHIGSGNNRIEDKELAIFRIILGYWISLVYVFVDCLLMLVVLLRVNFPGCIYTRQACQLANLLWRTAAKQERCSSSLSTPSPPTERSLIGAREYHKDISSSFEFSTRITYIGSVVGNNHGFGREGRWEHVWYFWVFFSLCMTRLFDMIYGLTWYCMHLTADFNRSSHKTNHFILSIAVNYHPLLESMSQFLLLVTIVKNQIISCISNYKLKTESCYSANFVVSGGTAGCDNDNLRCHQWRQSRHHDNSQLSLSLSIRFAHAFARPSWKNTNWWDSPIGLMTYICSEKLGHHWFE